MATSAATVMIYPSKLKYVGIEGNCPRAYKAVLEALKRFGKHERVSVVGKRYRYRWVIYYNTKKGLSPKLNEWLRSNFEQAPRVSAKEHRAAIESRMAQENILATHRARLWAFSYDQLLDAAIVHYGSKDAVMGVLQKAGFSTLSQGKLISAIAKDDLDLISISEALAASADIEQARVVEAMVVYDDPWNEELLESYDSRSEEADDEWPEGLHDIMEAFFATMSAKFLPGDMLLDDLKKLSRNKLRKRAKELGIKRWSVMTQEELVKAIAPVLYEVAANL